MTVTLDYVQLKPLDRRAWASLASPYQTHRTLANGLIDQAARLLWRREPDTQRLLVQVPPSTFDPAAIHGRWQAQKKRATLRLAVGQRLRFRLYANPTVQRDGSRIGIVDPDEQIAWLHRKLAAAATVLAVDLSRRSLQHMYQKRYDVVAAQYDGILQVEHAGNLLGHVAAGVGRSKHLGLGLLSLAKVAH